MALDHVEPGEQAGVVQHGREQAGRAALADGDAALDEHHAGQVAAPRAGPAGAAPQRQHLAGLDPDAMQRGGHQSLVVALGGGVTLLAGVDDARQLVAGERVRERGGVAAAAREDDAAAAVADVAPRDGHLRAQPVGAASDGRHGAPASAAPRRSCGAARRRDAVHGCGGGRRMHGTPGARPRRGEVVVPPGRFPVSFHGSPPGRGSQRGRGGSGGSPGRQGSPWRGRGRARVDPERASRSCDSGASTCSRFCAARDRGPSGLGSGVSPALQDGHRSRCRRSPAVSLRSPEGKSRGGVALASASSECTG